MLSDVNSGNLQSRPDKRRKGKHIRSASDLIMKQCRSVLRRVASRDKKKVFCNLLGRIMDPNDNDDKGLLGFPAMVSRPLDFRTIDLRLAVGAYGGSNEAFLEDVQEVCFVSFHLCSMVKRFCQSLLFVTCSLSSSYLCMYMTAKNCFHYVYLNIFLLLLIK